MTQTTPDIWTILRMIEWGTDYFKARHVDSPRLTIELMLAHALKLTRFDLYIQFDRPLISAELTQLRNMVKHRVSGQPLQYILGQAHFHRRIYNVNPHVLIPRPETELVVEEAMRRAPEALRCLDVGTGCGCIAVTIALDRPHTEVVAIDVSPQAVEVAQLNAEKLGASRVQFQCADFFDDAAMRALGTFDLIVSNPPYIPHADMHTLQPEVRDHEPELALTDNGDGYAFYKRFVALADTLLRDEADVFLELGFGQAERVERMFTNAGFQVSVMQDMEKHPRILWARKQTRA